ncbi:MAG: homocysteine S-methyltransferase family protein, partial [Pseudomonadota bacterium]
MTDIVLLDGGMGQELIHRAGDRPTPLWSTQVMFDHPGMVAAVHAEYAAAGATVHTTNTYAIMHDRLEGTPLEGHFAALHAAALKEAAGVGKRAGALGPIKASYRPDLLPPHEEAVAIYSEIAAQLAPAVDLLIAETVVSVAHASAVLEAMVGTGKPAWLACSVMDEDGTRLRSGEPLAEVFAVADAADAILVNCAVPEALDTAMPVLA